MKLRNKKTGEVEEFNEIYLTKTVKETNTATSEYVERAFYSISDLQDEFEDYKPAEPLIKDDKIRKAVRAWAEANEVFGASTYKSCSDGHYWYIRAFNDTERGIDIDLWGDSPKELIDCKYYTIAELCGEEEE